MERRQVTKDEESIQWHNAYCAATELELSDNADVLNFHREYILGKEPLQVDMLVVLAAKGAEFKNEIADRFFRGHNLIEYKSPGDKANIDTVYKTLAYTALYKAETGRCVDEVKDNDVTMTIMREVKPVKLLKTLEKRGCKITARSKGIYEIGHTVFPLQIIVTKELNEEDHVWLRSLTRTISLQEAKRLADQYRAIREKGTKEELLNAEMVVELVSKASNIELARDVKEEGIMTIMEMAAPMIEEERNKVAEEERKQGVRNMAEAYWELNGNAAMAAQKIRSKYPDVEKEFIDSVIREVYGI